MLQYNMRLTEYGHLILNELEIFEGLYSGKLIEISTILVDDIELCEKFNNSIKKNADYFSKITFYQSPLETVEVFDQNNQKVWYMPDFYKNFDIEKYVFSLCMNDSEIIRVEEELKLFNKHNMTTLLKYLKYLVDTMRENNIVW